MDWLDPSFHLDRFLLLSQLCIQSKHRDAEAVLNYKQSRALLHRRVYLRDFDYQGFQKRGWIRWWVPRASEPQHLGTSDESRSQRMVLYKNWLCGHHPNVHYFYDLCARKRAIWRPSYTVDASIIRDDSPVLVGMVLKMLDVLPGQYGQCK